MAKKSWMPPHGSGVRYKDLSKGRQPFQLIWGFGAHSRTYPDASTRELAARELLKKRSTAGDPVLEFDPEKWRRYLEFQAIVGPDVDPLVVGREWRASKQGSPKESGMRVPAAVNLYTALRDEERNWTPDSRRHALKHLGRFSDRFRDLSVAEVDPADLRAWLYGRKDDQGNVVDPLVDDEGNPIGPHGQRDHRKAVHTFFEYALREGWGAINNPCARVLPPKTDDGDPIVIPVRDAFTFFKANRDERLVGRIALEAFGAIRYTTAGLIQKDAIDFDRCGVRLSRHIHKTGKVDGRSRYRQGQPPNLWEWLRHAPEACWSMSGKDYYHAKRNAGIRAGLRPIENASAEDETKMEGLRNVWRHSFISYHLARYKCVPLTQYLAQHQSARTTQEYEGMATEIDAARYFMISPATTVVSWEEFVALPITPIKPVDWASIAAFTGL